MRIHFQIEYTNKDGDCVETLSSSSIDTPEDRKLLHDLLDEYLDKNTDFKDQQNGFHVTTECTCSMIKRDHQSPIKEI